MNFREWLMSENQYPQMSFNAYDGTLTVVIPESGKYVYQTPFGSRMGHVPPFIYKWERAMRAHPSNGFKVVLKSINQLIQNPASNWKILQKPEKPEPVPQQAPAPASDLTQKTLF